MNGNSHLLDLTFPGLLIPIPKVLRDQVFGPFFSIDKKMDQKNLVPQIHSMDNAGRQPALIGIPSSCLPCHFPPHFVHGLIA